MKAEIVKSSLEMEVQRRKKRDSAEMSEET